MSRHAVPERQLDVLVLDSGEWWLAEELPSSPWHILIYRQRDEARNELHLWLPYRNARRVADHAFRRFWTDGEERWCIESPQDPDRFRSVKLVRPGPVQLRFTRSDGLVLWCESGSGQRLGDFTDSQLIRLVRGARPGPYILRRGETKR